jgi:hypothetical protein
MDSRLTLKRGTLFRLPVRGVGMVLATLLLHACGGGGNTPLPEAGSMRGFVPDLRGRRVMVYPVQIRQSVPGDVDAEIAFALRERGSEIDWVFPEELRRTLARSPAIRSTADGLTATVFLRAKVDRVGDPLYGQIRRLVVMVRAIAE